MRSLPHGAGAIVCVLVGIWIFDTCSYVGGRLWGRHPIAPRTSPKKTVEGVVVGVAGGRSRCGSPGSTWTGSSRVQSLALGLIICAVAYVGDLFESMFKRDIGVKDSGRVLGAHGGVLDRFDALLFGGAAAYFVLIWLVY